MAMLTKEQILNTSDLVTETVAVPEWGGDVLIRTLTAKQFDDYTRRFTEMTLSGKRPNLTNMKATYCALAMVDDEGRRMFSDDEVMSLGNKSAKALNRVFVAAQDCPERVTRTLRNWRET